MNRKHRVVVCSNLMLLLETTKDSRFKEVLRKQYRRMASRIGAV